MNLTVACVEWGDYQGQGRGREYVRALKGMVAEHLHQAHEFVCFTDNPHRHPGIDCLMLAPGLVGWWNKLQLFAPDVFQAGRRILYLDLDSIITGPLDVLAASKGIIHLRDWGWPRDVYGSGVMVWDAGEHTDIWSRFDPAEVGDLHGDQDWITALGGWERFPPALARSYRYHCQQGVPEGCSVVCFHGAPKPHQAMDAQGAALQRIWRRHTKEALPA